MIVQEFNVRRSLRGPAKAKVVLVVDPNTELSFAVTFRRLQPVARRRAQELKGLSGVQLRQLSSRSFSDRRESLALAALEQGWTDATTAAQLGDLVAALAKGRAASARAQELRSALGLVAPAEAAPSAQPSAGK